MEDPRELEEKNRGDFCLPTIPVGTWFLQGGQLCCCVKWEQSKWDGDWFATILHFYSRSRAEFNVTGYNRASWLKDVVILRKEQVEIILHKDQS